MALLASITQNGTQLFPVNNSIARLRFFFGQLLTQKDLQTEQGYHLVLQRLIQRETFGTGTVAGLEVTTVDGTTAAPPRSVFVEPGLAFDPDGRELVLEQAACVTIADLPATSDSEDFENEDDIDTPAELAEAVADRFAGAFGVPDLDQLVRNLSDAGVFIGAFAGTRAQYFGTNENSIDGDEDMSNMILLLKQIPEDPAELEPGELLAEWIFRQLVGTTYLGIRFRENGTQPAPALLDASCCGETTCFPTRTQEGVFIAASSTPFPEPADPFKQMKSCLDAALFAQLASDDPPPGGQVDVHAALCQCLLKPWRGLPPLDNGCDDPVPPTVPLARVFWSRFATGTDSQILNIDNCTLRPLAPGGPAIRALLESLTGGAEPATLAPRIVSYTPENGTEFSPAETTTDFVLTATANAELDPPATIAAAWQITFYANGEATPIVHTSTLNPLVSGRAVTVTIDGPSTIRVAFDDGGELDPGVYVWRVSIAPNEFSATANGAKLDGEPNPPAVVPSGDGLVGGAFEARFVVTE